MKKQLLGAAAALALVGAIAAPGAFAADTMPGYLSDGLSWCQGNQAAATTLDEKAWADHCVVLAQRQIDAWNAAHPAPTTPPATTPPATTPPATTPPPAAFPDATNTGVPAGTTLTAYTGPCTITTPNTVIDSKTINCSLSIQTTGVQITKSKVTGTVSDGSGDAGPGRSFSVIDSEVTCAVDTTCVGESNFTVTRSNLHGGNRMAHCYKHCLINDSWLHGVRITSVSHASAMRFGQDTTVSHNTLACDVADTSQGGGCSADLTGYPDFEPVNNLTATYNHFVNSPAYFCAYGGWNPGKAFNTDPTNATYIVFDHNTFDRGPSGRCGGPTDGGPPITSYEPTRTGNKFTNNVWAPDGALVKP